MAGLLPNEETLQEIIQDADARLRHFDPSPFSLRAFSALIEKISEFIARSVSESIKVARRQQADTVSVAHVEQACQYLVCSPRRRLFRHLGTVGGALLGASLSNTLVMILADQCSAVGTITAIGLGITGAFVIALHMAKD
jgi:hypothetical protein